MILGIFKNKIKPSESLVCDNYASLTVQWDFLCILKKISPELWLIALCRDQKKKRKEDHGEISKIQQRRQTARDSIVFVGCESEKVKRKPISSSSDLFYHRRRFLFNIRAAFRWSCEKNTKLSSFMFWIVQFTFQSVNAESSYCSGDERLVEVIKNPQERQPTSNNL